jgi:hypothetical protein
MEGGRKEGKEKRNEATTPSGVDASLVEGGRRGGEERKGNVWPPRE